MTTPPFLVSNRRWLALVALPLLVLAIYWPGLNGGFAFDDYPNIVDNPALKLDTLDGAAWRAAAFSSNAGSLQRPVAMLSFAVNTYFAGMDPVAMKATNVAIHAINALLVLGLVRLLFALAAPGVDVRRRTWAAAFVAVAWALHPINTMGVLYIVQRMESLAHTFVFAGLWLYLIGRQRQLAGENGRWWIAAGLFGCTALGALCKESAVLLPLYAWLAEACIPALRTSPQKGDVRKLFLAVLWLPLVAGIFWLYPRVTAPNAFSTRDFNLEERLLTEGRVLVDYLRWTIAPPLRELTLYHDDYLVSRGWMSPPSTLYAMIGLALLAAFAWWMRARRPLVALGVLWFFAAQALTATVVPLELVYEHRNYFASMGVLVAVADLLLLAPRDALKRIGALVAILLTLGYAGTTHLRAREWSNPLRFANIEAQKRPQSPRATYGYGRMLVIASKYAPDSPFVPVAVRELERAITLPQSGILPHSALLLLAAHAHLPQKQAWWDDVNARLRRGPIGPQEINAVGSIMRCARNHECVFSEEHMVGMFEAALVRPHADMQTMYGDYMLNVLKQPDRAQALFEAAVKLRPEVSQYRVNLAKVYISLGQDEKAREQIAELRELGKFGEEEAAAQELESRLAVPPAGSTR
ncbi:tetratricopeptide repeat protein [Lysobacter sp. 2RAF19]